MLSPEAPYPLDGGGALRTASLLQHFSRDYDVDLIVFQHPGQIIVPALPPGLVRSALTVELRRHSNRFAAKAQRNAGRILRRHPPLVDRFSGYEAEIASHLAGQAYDVAVLEHFWTASYLPLIRRFAQRTVLDLHNVESRWHGSCAEASSFPHAAMHRCFARAAETLEKKWLPLCDLALAASAQDAGRLRALAPDLPVCIYPNAIPFRETEPRPAKPSEFVIAFSGNMEYEPNRAGLLWFVTRVWPDLRKRFPALALRLIGKNAQTLPVSVRAAAGVACTGWVADPFVSLEGAELCIAPLLSGSGTRLKIIEAWAAGRAVVSTSIGAEGLAAVDGDSILIADQPVAFADAISRLLLDPPLRQKIANAGRELFQQKYTWNVVSKTLSACLTSKIS